MGDDVIVGTQTVWSHEFSQPRGLLAPLTSDVWLPRLNATNRIPPHPLFLHAILFFWKKTLKLEIFSVKLDSFMVVGSSSTKQGLPSWIGATAATRTATAMDLDRSSPAASTAMANGEAQQSQHANSDVGLGFVERAFSAAGAAVVSAILVNPLDVAKVARLHIQLILHFPTITNRLYFIIIIIWFSLGII